MRVHLRSLLLHPTLPASHTQIISHRSHHLHIADHILQLTPPSHCRSHLTAHTTFTSQITSYNSHHLHIADHILPLTPPSHRRSHLTAHTTFTSQITRQRCLLSHSAAIWDAALLPHAAAVSMGLVNSDPSISDQESAIVTCSADGTIRLWSLTHEGEEIGRASSTGAFCVIINLARAQWMARLGYTS